MREKPLVWVAYDTSKTDESCVVCTEPDNGRAKMLVGYMGDDADELYKIVSEQGYLAEHDAQIRADERLKFAEWLSNHQKIYIIDGYMWKKCVEVVECKVTLEDVLAEYEKEQQ